jgi:hypothetical protein
MNHQNIDPMDGKLMELDQDRVHWRILVICGVEPASSTTRVLTGELFNYLVAFRTPLDDTGCQMRVVSGSPEFKSVNNSSLDGFIFSESKSGKHYCRVLRLSWP